MDKELLNKLSQISLSKEDREQIEKVNESNKKYWKDLAEYRRDCYMRQTDKYKNYSFTKITHDKQTYNTKDSLMFKVEDAVADGNAVPALFLRVFKTIYPARRTTWPGFI